MTAVSVTRGAFLKTCGLALAAPALDVPWLRALAPRNPAAGSAAEFREYLDSDFHVSSIEGAETEMRLVDVLDGLATSGFEQFSLRFSARDTSLAWHGTYTFRHNTFGTLDLFIVPAPTRPGTGAIYEACFSRMVKV